MTDEEVIGKYTRVIGEQRDKVGDELVARYADGQSIRVICQEIGRSYGFVHRMLIEREVQLRPRGMVKP